MSSGKISAHYLRAQQRRNEDPKSFILRNETANRNHRTKSKPISLPTVSILKEDKEA